MVLGIVSEAFRPRAGKAEAITCPASRWSGKPGCVSVAPMKLLAPLLALAKCDSLLSGAALQREGGAWIGAACVRTREERTMFAFTNVPAGKFARLRLHACVSTHPVP